MNFKILMLAFCALAIASCKHSNNIETEHDAHSDNEVSGVHDEVKFQYTVYSNEYELFAEADAFVVNETANVLSYFSALPDFRALEDGKITLILAIDGTETRQTLDNPTRKGIYSFYIQPKTKGKGTLRFKINNKSGNFEIIVPEVSVFANDEEAHEASEKMVVSKTNTTVFTKEQSWKIDFSTNYPKTEPFGQVIKTTALVEPAPGDEMIVTAKTNGIVALTSNKLLEGLEVKAGQALCSIKAGNLAENNISVKYSEAKSNFEKTNSDYERAKELAKNKIVSEKDLMAVKNQFENAKAVYDNLNKNFNLSGQTVRCPISGFIKQVFVKNGTYIEAGQAILTVSQNKTLLLRANVPLKYASVLSAVQSANIHALNDTQTYTLEQLNGKVLSYGKAANTDNYLIPVSLQINKAANFVAGSFVEVYLKSLTNSQVLTVPNSALMEEQGIYFVYVQVNPELFEKREVKVGGTDGLHTEIKTGISSKNRIVTKGAMMIKLSQSTGTLDAHSGHVH